MKASRSSDSADSSTRPLWRQLELGDYGCGFKSLWQFDYGRTYNRVFDDKTVYAAGKSPRPMLINLWYPTKVKTFRTAMPYGDYLRIHSEDTRIARLSDELAEYARAILVKEVFFKEEETFTSEEQKAFQSLLETRTAAGRDAPAANGRFPLVVYHAGYGSSFEDSSVLCEYLASHGYVVIGSAFQKIDGTSLNIEGGARTAGDLRFLLSFAHSLPFVDWDHVGMVGHSGGAQAALIYQTEPGCAVDAMVSLDTTEDYYNLDDPRWNYMTEPVMKSIATLSRPILFAANPRAGFEMADAMTSTPRYIFSVDALNHDDYITHGSLERWVKVRLASDHERETVTAEANQIWNRYEALCRTVLHFLDATLKEQSDALEAQVARDRAEGFQGDRPHLAYVAVGEDGPKPYDGSEQLAPSPRQTRQLLRTKGVSALLTVLRERWRPESQEPTFDTGFAFSLIYQSFAQGKTDQAIALYRFFNEIGRLPASLFLNWGRMDKRPGSKMQFGRTCFECLLALDPDNQEAALELKSLEASTPAS